MTLFSFVVFFAAVAESIATRKLSSLYEKKSHELQSRGSVMPVSLLKTESTVQMVAHDTALTDDAMLLKCRGPEVRHFA